MEVIYPSKGIKHLFCELIKKKPYLLKAGILFTEKQLINWFKVFKPEEFKLSAGFIEDGYWVVSTVEGLKSIQKRDDCFFLLPLLENDIFKVKRIFEELSNGESLYDLFPIKEIILYTIRHKSPYWLELALSWYEKIDAPIRLLIKDDLNQIRSDKNLPQSLRNKIWLKL